MVIIAYVIVILLFIRELRVAHPLVTQTWYAEKAGAGGSFGNIHRHLEYLVVRGTYRGYFLDTTKIILVVSGKNFQRFQKFF